MVASTDPHRWLHRAKIDLKSAEVNLAHGPAELAEAICYSCHQAAEKALKAYLLAHGKEVIRTHDLVHLISLSADIDADFNRFDDAAYFLNDFAVAARYPSDIAEPYDEGTAHRAVTYSQELLAFIETKINLAPGVE